MNSIKIFKFNLDNGIVTSLETVDLRSFTHTIFPNTTVKNEIQYFISPINTTINYNDEMVIIAGQKEFNEMIWQ